MPIYDLICLDCSHQFEELVKDPAAAVPCPHCQSLKTERLPSLVGGYSFDSGGGSVRPRQAGSFKQKRSKT